MGRELRRVPVNWEHPRDVFGQLQPLYDRAYEDAAKEWLARFMAYRPEDHNGEYYWDYAGPPPDKHYYRPAWTEAEATHFQVYETVTEGTPVSPVLPTRETVAEWLQRPGKYQGYRKAAAEAFARDGWAPSGVLVPGLGWMDGMEGLSLLANKEE